MNTYPNLSNVKRKNSIFLVPNILSLTRIGLSPVICFMLLTHGDGARKGAFFLFVLACITDYMDGYIARHQKQSSRFGMVLDPFADKCLTASISFTLMYAQLCSFVGFLCLSLMMIRDIAITTLRSFVGHNTVPVCRSAKIKTVVQMLGIASMIVPYTALNEIAPYILAVGCCLSVYTGLVYFRHAIKQEDW